MSQKKLLVLSVAYSSGWTAYMDGQKKPLYQVNGMFTGLMLEAGDHTVELRYRTPYLIPGLMISICCIVVCAALEIRWRKKK